jgi:hypothetical protein
MMKNNPIQLIEAILIGIAAIGMTSVYQHFCENIQNSRRSQFWKIRNAERLLFAAATLVLLLGYINAGQAVAIISLVTLASSGYDAYYVNGYLSNPKSYEGRKVPDEVAFFFIRPLLLQLRKERTVELDGLQITLLRENGYAFELSIVAEKNVIFPWQLHFGIEKIKLKKGALKYASELSKPADREYTLSDLQAHCFQLIEGTELTTTITLSDKI